MSDDNNAYQEDEYRRLGVKLNKSLNTRFLLNNVNVFVLNKKNLQVLILAEVVLALNCIIGDHFIFDSNRLIKILVNEEIGLTERLVRALMDNSSHAIVGACSWFLITYPFIKFNELLLSGLISSLIDLDHFVSSKSFHLVDAIAQANNKRPFLHNSLLLLILNFIVFVCVRFSSQYINNRLKYLSLLIFVSWFNHHVRDANRRGLWLGPIFTTKPLNDAIYLSIVLVLPLFLRKFYDNSTLFYKNDNNNNNVKFVNPSKELVHIV